MKQQTSMRRRRTTSGNLVGRRNNYDAEDLQDNKEDEMRRKQSNLKAPSNGTP